SRGRFLMRQFISPLKKISLLRNWTALIAIVVLSSGMGPADCTNQGTGGSNIGNGRDPTFDSELKYRAFQQTLGLPLPSQATDELPWMISGDTFASVEVTIRDGDVISPIKRKYFIDVYLKEAPLF